jgi:hypothetical protein
MQLSQLTLKPHTCVILVEYKLCTHTCLFLSSVLFGTSSTAAQYQATWRITSADSTISRRCLPVDVPVAPYSSYIYFYASAFLELILDSVVIKIFIL